MKFVKLIVLRKTLAVLSENQLKLCAQNVKHSRWRVVLPPDIKGLICLQVQRNRLKCSNACNLVLMKPV